MSLMCSALNQIKSAIPKKMLKKLIKNYEQTPVDREFSDILHSEHPSQVAYHKLLHMNQEDRISKKSEKWSEELCCEVDIVKQSQRIGCVSQVAKFSSFQYRMLHRAIVTNVQMHRWGMIDSPSCTFCHGEVESYFHLFFDCEKVRPVWDCLKETIVELKLDFNARITYCDVVLVSVSSNEAAKFSVSCGQTVHI